MVGAMIAKRAVRSGFDALNEGNLEKFMKAWSENCSFIYPGRVKAGGQFIGKSQVKKWFESFVEQFPQRRFTVNHVAVDNMFDLVGNNTVFAHLYLELINKDGLKCVNGGVSRIRIAGSKIIEVEDYLKIIDGDDYKRGWGDIK